MKSIIIVFILMIITPSFLVAQSSTEKNKEIVFVYMKAMMEADLNTLTKVLDKNYRHFLFDIPKEDYDSLLNLVKKKGKGGNWEVHENIAIGDKVVTRWTAEFPPNIYRGMNLYTFKNGKIIEEREFYMKVD